MDALTGKSWEDYYGASGSFPFPGAARAVPVRSRFAHLRRRDFHLLLSCCGAWAFS